MLKKRIKLLIAASIVFATQNAHAALTPYNSNGIDLVYSSVSDVTWTKDANLLGSMIASQGYSAVINAIITASPSVNNTPSSFDGYTGTYKITSANFISNDLGLGLSLGLTDWFGAVAFINYLNSINYGGSDQWRLPVSNVSISSNSDALTAQNGAFAGEEYAELYYSELGRNYNQTNVVLNGLFENEQERAYWSGAEWPTDADGALTFSMSSGTPGFSYKGYVFYAWAVSSGQIAAIPEPESIAMLLAGLGLIGIAIRHNR